jgi:hypothetical protein
MMNNEDLQRKMAFIVEQQAQFAFGIQRLEESQARTDQVVAQTGEIVARLANVTLEGFEGVNAKIDALVDLQIRTDENVSRTDETLRNLIAVVDRYFTEPIIAGVNQYLLLTAIQQPVAAERGIAWFSRCILRAEVEC